MRKNENRSLWKRNSHIVEKIDAAIDILLKRLPFAADFSNAGTIYGGFLRFIVEYLETNQKLNGKNIEKAFFKYNTDIDVRFFDHNTLRKLFVEIVEYGGSIEYYGMKYTGNTVPDVNINLENKKALLQQGNYAIFIPYKGQTLKYDINFLPAISRANDFTVNRLVCTTKFVCEDCEYAAEAGKCEYNDRICDRCLAAIDDIRTKSIRWIFKTNDPKILYRCKKLLDRGYKIAEPEQAMSMASLNQKYRSGLSRRFRNYHVSEYQFAFELDEPTRNTGKIIRTTLKPPIEISYDYVMQTMKHIFDPKIPNRVFKGTTKVYKDVKYKNAGIVAIFNITNAVINTWCELENVSAMVVGFLSYPNVPLNVKYAMLDKYKLEKGKMVKFNQPMTFLLDYSSAWCFIHEDYY
jgi:hypothetical protein